MHRVMSTHLSKGSDAAAYLLPMILCIQFALPERSGTGDRLIPNKHEAINNKYVNR